METTANKSPHLLMWVVGISVILFCMVGIAAFMGWIPTSSGNPAASPAGASLATGSATGSATNPNPATNPATSLSAAPPSPVAHVPKAPRAPKAAAPTAERAVARASCADCGVIESTRMIDMPGNTSALGVVGGALVGGVLGHQVGGGRGQDLATVAGAVGGAVAGNQIEKQARASKRYETTVRFDDGSTRVFSETVQPQWRNGDRIRVVDGAIRFRD